MTPQSVSIGSRFLAAWRCERGCKNCKKPHEWQATVRLRCLSGTNCPFCSRSLVCSCQSLAKIHSALLKQWDFEGNTGIDPNHLACTSRKLVSWRCKQHGRWSAQVDSRVYNGSGCPICALSNLGTSKRGLMKDECPDVYKEVHPSRNPGIDVSSLTCGSTQELVWLCTRGTRPDGCKCEHAWKITVATRCKKRNPSGCPFCSRRATCLCISVATLYPGLMQYWCAALNSDVDPEATGALSTKVVWWEHVCVDGRMHRQQKRVYQVVRNFVKTGRFPCKACAGKEFAAIHAEKYGRLINCP